MPVNKNKEKLNPCWKEQEMTYKCLNDSSYDKDKCGLYFENYKQCKKFWGTVQSDRKRQGLSPWMPPVEERESIIEEYKRKFS